MLKNFFLHGFIFLFAVTAIRQILVEIERYYMNKKYGYPPIYRSEGTPHTPDFKVVLNYPYWIEVNGKETKNPDYVNQWGGLKK